MKKIDDNKVKLERGKFISIAINNERETKQSFWGVLIIISLRTICQIYSTPLHGKDYLF